MTATSTPPPADNPIDRAVVLDSGHIKASFVDSTIIVLEPQGRSFSVMLPISLWEAKLPCASSALEREEEEEEEEEV